MKPLMPIAVACMTFATLTVSAADAEPWKIAAGDGLGYFDWDSSRMDVDGLVAFVDGLKRSGVTHFFMRVNGQRAYFDSKVLEPVWAGLARGIAPREDGAFGVWHRRVANMKSLVDAGIDCFDVWTHHCRNQGISPWVTIGMNECLREGALGALLNSPFCQHRRDLWRVSDGSSPEDCALDYAQREVRERALVFAQETVRRWDVDGIELDWTRDGLHFRPNHERDDARFLTRHIRMLRGVLAREGHKRGRTIRLAVRVPRDPDLCVSLGLDLDAWLVQDLVDVIIGSGIPESEALAASKVWNRFVAARKSTVPFVAVEGDKPDAGTWTRRLVASEEGRFHSDAARCRVHHGVPRNVPPLLTTFGGEPVRTLSEWEARRTEIRERFLSQMYGRRPAEADQPTDLKFEPVEADREMLDGRAIRRRIRCEYGGKYGCRSFTFTAFIPKSVRPTPAFLLICNRDPKVNLDPERKVKSEFWPVERIVERGYAAIAFWNGDVTSDFSWDFENGVFGVFQKPWERSGESWGILSAWAWGASRVMDWIETEPRLDAKHVAVVGHSRGGKTALFAGVSDVRFALVCSNCSGCGGAKLNHMELPESEHIDQICAAVGCWFCNNFYRYRCREFDMDFDQHMWAALVAPRLLAIASASEDNWAGQEGEFETARLASPAWAIYGRRGLVGSEFPAPGEALQEGSVSYHLRPGKHDLTIHDWDRYMDFADRHEWVVGCEL